MRSRRRGIVGIFDDGKTAAGYILCPTFRIWIDGISVDLLRSDATFDDAFLDVHRFSVYLFREKETSAIGASMFPREMLLQMLPPHRFETEDAVKRPFVDDHLEPASFPVALRPESVAIFAKPVLFVNVGHKAR